MTQNQIAYHNAQELARHNKAVEEETNRHQVMQEKIQNVSNALQKWQIAVNNLHYARMDAETERANKAREQQNLWGIQETQRSNLMQESIKSRTNQINAAAVAETSRHQKAMESIQSNLNNSVISRNYAEVGYTEARTRTESYQPSLIVNQIDVANSQANLNRERMNTEKANQFGQISQGVSSIVNAGTGVIKTIVPLVSGGLGSGGHGSNLVEIVNSL